MILKSMGVEVNKSDMDNYASEVDEEETGKFTFMMFCQVAAKFMIEDDEEQMKEELKEAFRFRHLLGLAVYDQTAVGLHIVNTCRQRRALPS